MTVRNFWRIFLKGLGIWLVLETILLSFKYVSTLVPMLIELSKESSVIPAIFISLFFFGWLVLLLYIFVFRTEWLIDIFRLEGGFNDEKIDINISQRTFIAVIIATVSGLSLVTSLPALIQSIFNFYQHDYVFRQSPSANIIVFNLVQTVISIVCMTYAFSLSKLFLKLSNSKVAEDI